MPARLRVQSPDLRRRRDDQFSPPSTEIRQDAEIYFGKADAGTVLEAPASEAMPNGWLQVIEGEIEVLGETLSTGDGIAIEDAMDAFHITADADSKFLFFRLN